MWFEMRNRTKGIQMEHSYISYAITMMNIYFHSQGTVFGMIHSAVIRI